MNGEAEGVVGNAVAGSGASGTDALVRRDLSMLGHVNVKLEVALGNAEVAVDELFALAKGDSLTLDSLLDEPVKIQLDGKVIALGHLMAVGDNFGIKIVEIL